MADLILKRSKHNLWGLAFFVALNVGAQTIQAPSAEAGGAGLKKGTIGATHSFIEESQGSEADSGRAAGGPIVRRGTVTKISDGDTIHFLPEGASLSSGAVLKVRMMTEDTPELHLPGPGGMHSQGWWAEKATEVLADLIPVGSRVKLLDYGKDVYGRTLGRVKRADGLDVNRAMVESGWGVLYLICSGETCNPSFFEEEEVDLHVASCEKAVSAKLGVFDPADPLLEMPFEFRLRIQKRAPDKWVGNLATHELVAPADYQQVPICQRLFFRSKEEAMQLGFLPDSHVVGGH